MTWTHLAPGLVLHLGFHVDGSLIDARERVVPRVVSKRRGTGRRQSFKVFKTSAVSLALSTVVAGGKNACK